MKTFSVLLRRNMRLFFRDKGMFFTSLITPAILLVLYVTFLGDVYRDSFVTVYFTVFQLAGQFFSVQMGFGASEVFDPLSQISLPIMGQFLYMIFTLVFMLGNGPAYILNGLFESFSRVNFADLLRTSMTGSNYGLLAAMGDLFVVALKISFPILAMLLFVSVTQGLLAKASPQMNLQSVGFQISIFIGFVILMLVTPALVNIIGNIVEHTFVNVLNLMAEMGNG